MPRRSKPPDLVHDLHHVFLHIPTWLCLPAALLAYAGVQLALNLAASSNPVYRALVQQSGSLFSYLAAGVVLLAGLTAALKKSGRRALYDQQRSLESIRALDWREFEQLTGEAYRRQGYRVTENGGGGADGGVDLILHKEGERWLVQCKQWRVFKVGVKPVRELYGVLMAHRADGAIFVTSGTYTQEAQDFAAGKSLRLVDGEALCRLVLPVQAESAVPPLRSRVEIAASPTTASAEEMPACPVCERMMVRRTAMRSTNAGAQFWGCSAYPRCRGTRPLAT